MSDGAYEAHPSGNDRYTFCPKCGAPFGREVRAGRERLVCSACRFVFWQNPNAGVAAIIIEDGAVLLTKRGGSERAGLWDIPGGFVEYDEDIRDALVREILEETGLTIEVGRVYDVRSNFFHDTQRHSVGVWFLARRLGGTLCAADDVVAARFFPLDALPPDDVIAFETDRAVLASLQARPPKFEGGPQT
ncbi:MAG: NUDIX hydrolase [Chloroflexi bacterium]|nr:NUDIX hydrolase [Chloroflexota bacterium]